VSAPLIVLDIGSSLVEGPSRGPASRIAEAAGLDVSSKRGLHRLLMTRDYADPEDAWTDAREQLGLADPAIRSAIADIWKAQEKEARPIIGAFEVLQELTAKGYRLALLSNIWTPYLQSVRRLLGDFFDAHIPPELQLFSCREGLMKPAPELFVRVLERAGAHPPSTLMAGDSYDKDIAPAAMLGMRTLWLLHDPARETPALVQVLNGAAAAPTLTLPSLADLDLQHPWLAKYLPCPAKAGPGLHKLDGIGLPIGEYVKILWMEAFPAEFLLSRLRQTRLRGFGGAQPYIDASLELVPGVDTEALTPAQNYVLTPGVDKIVELRTAVLTKGVDIFALNGCIHVVTSDDPDERIPVIPPVIEESSEPDGRSVLLINDGMHRVFAARSLGLPISVVIVRGVPAEYPYYAFALDGGWSRVTPLAELPDGHQKKEYRQPTNYKALFRDFNAMFPGVQKQRKQSNPNHIAM